MAKNVAARRAAGKYLLFTTSDIAWTSPLISFLANKLDETIGDLKAYVVGYRINFMWEGGALDPDRTLYQCINNSTELRMMGGPRNMSDPKARQETWDLMDNFAEEYQTTQVMQRTTPNSFVGGYHIQAPGDFTLLPKSKYEGIVIMFPYNQRFFDIRGYGEVPTYAHWDSILLFMAGAPEFRMQQVCAYSDFRHNVTLARFATTNRLCLPSKSCRQTFFDWLEVCHPNVGCHECGTSRYCCATVSKWRRLGPGRRRTLPTY